MNNKSDAPIAEQEHSGASAQNARACRLPSWSAHAWIVFRKDLLLERHSGELTVTSGFFAALVAILASVALHTGPSVARSVAPAVVWIAVAFAAILAVGKSWQREREEGALRGLLAAPVPRSAIFAGKSLGVMVFLAVVEAIVVLVVAVLFSIDLLANGLSFALIALAATPGIAVTSTLFGAMTIRTRARDLALATVLFPLLLPTLLAAIVATRELVAGAPLHELTDYLMLMFTFDLVFTAGGLSLFGLVMDS